MQQFELAFPFETIDSHGERGAGSGRIDWFLPCLLKSVEEDQAQFQSIYNAHIDHPSSSYRFARIYQFHHVIPNGMFGHFSFRVCQRFNTGFQQRMIWKD